MDELHFWAKNASTFHFTSLQVAIVQQLNQTDGTVMSALRKTPLRLQIEKNLAAYCARLVMAGLFLSELFWDNYYFVVAKPYCSVRFQITDTDVQAKQQTLRQEKLKGDNWMLFDVNLQEDFPIFIIVILVLTPISANMLQTFTQLTKWALRTFPGLCTRIMISELGHLLIITDVHFCIRIR